MERCLRLIVTVIQVSALGLFIAGTSLGADLEELSDCELDEVYAGDVSEQWIDFQATGAEAVTPLFMGDVTIQDSAMENLRAMVSVVAAGSVINISLNVAVVQITNAGNADVDVQFFSDVNNFLNLANFADGL